MASDLITNTQPPSLYDFVLMFELLDEDHTGMLSAKNLRTFMETAEKIKRAGFDMIKFEGDLAKNEQIKKQFDEVEIEL